MINKYKDINFKILLLHGRTSIIKEKRDKDK